MTQNIGILDRARRLQARIKVKHETNKEIRRHRYQIFLQQNTGHLPSRNKLYRWRIGFIFTAVAFLIVPAVQILFFYGTIWESPDPLYPGMDPSLQQLWDSFLNEIPDIFGAIFFILFCFGLTVDWVIYRRWGNKYTIFKW